MVTKIKDVKGKDRPPGTVHYIRYITKNNVATTLCDETFKSVDWQCVFNEKVDCPNCLLATIKREEVIRRPQKENMSTKFYLGLAVIVVGVALYVINYLFSTF